MPKNRRCYAAQSSRNEHHVEFCALRAESVTFLFSVTDLASKASISSAFVSTDRKEVGSVYWGCSRIVNLFQRSFD